MIYKLNTNFTDVNGNVEEKSSLLIKTTINKKDFAKLVDKSRILLELATGYQDASDDDIYEYIEDARKYGFEINKSTAESLIDCRCNGLYKQTIKATLVLLTTDTIEFIDPNVNETFEISL